MDNLTEMYSGPVVGFDTETTGVDVFDPNTRVVTCALVYSPDPFSQYTVKEWLLDPEVEIPIGASEVHGIYTEQARAEGMDYKTGLQEIANALYHTIQQGIPLSAYNAAFDISLLRNEFWRHGIHFPLEVWDQAVVVDPLTIDRAIDKYRKGKRTLESVAAMYDYDLTNAHEATADVYATIHIARRILPKLEKKIQGFGLEMNNENLMGFQKTMYAEYAAGLQKFFRKDKQDDTIVINGEWPYKLTPEKN